jgi:hypothetical protein
VQGLRHRVATAQGGEALQNEVGHLQI